jgi:hypothetical protein
VALISKNKETIMKKIMMAFIGLFLGVSFVAEGKQAEQPQ